MVEWADRDLIVYFDDSGTHTASNIAIAAAYVSTVEQWRKFEQDWKSINDREGFGVFHCSDFYGRFRPFDTKEWKDKEKWDRTLRSCIGIGTIRAKYGSVRAIAKEDYDEVFGKDEILLHIVGKFHYTFAVQACLNDIKKFRDGYFPGAKVKYVFDQMSAGKGEIIWLMERMIRDYDGVDGFGMVPFEDGGYTFKNKAEVVQLQAADILAWHGHRHASNKYVFKDSRAPSPYMQLVFNNLKVETGIYFRDLLTTIADGVRGSERYKELEAATNSENAASILRNATNVRAKSAKGRER